MGEDTEGVKKYREEKSLELIEKYKDLIKKTFAVADKDLLQEQIEDEEDETQKEAKLLEALKKRRVALDEVDIMLDKIEKLEKHFNTEEGEEKEVSKTSFAKKNAKRNS